MMKRPEKPAGSRFTDEQWQAVTDEGENILVSASAGSGKTTVLVQRVIEKMKASVNIDELLVVTFTNAAAREMKERIQLAIQKELVNAHSFEQRRHLGRQLPLLGQADISTLHSFCLKVIRRYYYLIDFDPVFRLLTDDTETTLMKEEVWNELREELYGESDTRFHELAQMYSNDKNDDGLTDLIFKLYDFSRAHPEPLKWLSNLTRIYDVPEDQLASSPLFQEFIRPRLIESFETAQELLQTALSIGEGEVELEKTNTLLSNELALVTQLKEAIASNQFDQAYDLIHHFDYVRWYVPNKKTTPEEVKEAGKEMKVFRDHAKDSIVALKEDYFLFTAQEQVTLMSDVRLLIEEMARVGSLFYERYQAYKSARKVLDFNDLEHLTLDILVNKHEDGWEPTEASIHYRQQFKEVMVDEYQDINLLQGTILKWLTKDSHQAGNQFMVGDVKQSIYSFRLADPKLFLEKYEDYASGKGGKRIVLAENFRSRETVLSFVNFIFEQLMDKEVGDLAYDDAAQLINGFKAFPESTDFDTDILIYESNQDDKVSEDDDELEDMNVSFEIDTKTKGELVMVANKIIDMVSSGFLIYDKDNAQMRPIRYKDIVLLTPTKKNNIDIQDVFGQLGIPTAVKDTQNYFRTTEITIMMSLLKAIDNPYQDIPLVAVLRSPIVGLDEVDLTRIRLMNKESSFYEALLAFAEKSDWKDSKNIRLQQRIRLFLDSLETWRKQARRKTLVELIWVIYEETGFLHYVGGMSSGRQRKANLHALYERAAAYEKTSFKGLFQFIRFIEQMQKKDKDLAEPSAVADGEDAVRVMTIHASKGLEFPVVFVMDMTKRFNLSDASGAYVFDEEYGLGSQFTNLETREVKPTLPELVLKHRKKNKLLSESMRVLYVALTRAEQKLFLVGSYKSKDKALEKWELAAGHTDTVLAPDLRLSASSYMDWIGMSLIRHQSMDEVRHLPAIASSIHHYATGFNVHFFEQDQLEETIISRESDVKEEWYEELKKGKWKEEADKEVIKAVSDAVEMMNKPYAYQLATQTTSYQSVSEIKRLFEEPQDGQMIKIDVTNPRQSHRYVEDELSRPSFVSEALKPSPAEVGQATHLVLQALDLKDKPDADRIAKKVDDLVREKVLTEELGSLIDTQKLAQFFDTAFGEFILSHTNHLKREVPFSLLMEASDIFRDMDQVDDTVLIHGIVDGYIELEDGIVLFDYKTDQVERFQDQAAEVMLKKYSGQLNLYKKALESILNKPVREAYIVLLDTTEVVKVNERNADL